MFDPSRTSRRRSFLLCVIVSALAASCATTACRSTPATPAATVSADTWAVVDGQTITREDVDKAYRRARDASQTLSDEETLTAKLSLLNDLIVQQILLEKARAPETRRSPERARHRVQQREEEHYGRGLSAGAEETQSDARGHAGRPAARAAHPEGHRIRKWDRRSPSRIEEITDFFNANRSQFNVAEESYHLAQIVVTPVREAQTANATGDDAASPEAAVAKVRMLMERLKGGASFRDLATGYSEDPQSAPRGGDLGFVPVSRLKQAPPQLRDAVLNKSPGSVSVASGGGAHTLVLVVAHEQAGQRDLSTPGVRERISETLRARKEQLLRAAYLTAARGDAAVVNYLARRLVESKGQMPEAPLGAPGGR